MVAIEQYNNKLDTIFNKLPTCYIKYNNYA